MFRLNNYRIKEIFNDSLKWYFDSIKINNKKTCTLLLLKNNPIHLFLDLKYVDCIHLYEDEGMMPEGFIVGSAGKAYSIKIRMNDKFIYKLTGFKDDECFVVKIKILNDYFYFFRSVKQLRRNKEFDISNYSRSFNIKIIKRELKEYTNIICP